MIFTVKQTFELVAQIKPEAHNTITYHNTYFFHTIFLLIFGRIGCFGYLEGIIKLVIFLFKSIPIYVYGWLKFLLLTHCMYTVYTVLLDTFSPAVRVNNMKKKNYMV
jgi:hypothetical protein